MLDLEAKTARDAGTYLELWRVGGKHKAVERPFDPYFYSHYPVRGCKNEKMEKTLLSTLKKQDVFKCSFPDIYSMNRSRAPGAMEDDIRYDQKVATTINLATRSELPACDSFDLEFWGGRITAISYYGENLKDCVTYHEMPEDQLLEWFIDNFNVQDPDLPCTYWGSFSDWQELIDASRRLKIPLKIGRDGSEPWIRVHTYEFGKRKGEDHFVNVRGRVHFDVWKEAVMDQTLYGVKNMRLKTLGRHFKFDPIIEYPYSELPKLDAKRLKEYCLNDSRLTERLAEVYLRNLIPLVEQMGMTVRMGVERAPSHMGNFMYFRRFGAKGIVADKNNIERFPQFEGGYQGALVGLGRPGLYRDFRHLDFKSMYPNTFIVYNYSPETIKKCSVVPCGPKELFDPPSWVEFRGKEIWVYDKYAGIIKLEIDQEEDSITRQEFVKLAEKRKNIRNSDLPFEVKESQQWAVKTIMNSAYGYHGLRTSRCGCFPLSAHSTGHGRWMASLGLQHINKAGCIAIEWDTDGIFYAGEECGDSIIENIKEKVPDPYLREYISLEDEKVEAGIFYDEKGYVLKDKGKLKFHGSGLKGKHLPRLCDVALERVTNMIFDEPGSAYSELNNIGHGLAKLPETDFAMTVKMNKDPSDYDERNMYGELAKRAGRLGIKVRWGDEISYVKTADRGYMPVKEGMDYILDYRYYRERLADVMVRLLGVSHGLSVKEVLLYLKGARHN